MQRGDLSNKVLPSLVIVFEGAIGTLREGNVADFDEALGKDRIRMAMTYFDLDPNYLRIMLDLVWRRGFNIHLVTWMGEDAAEYITELMDEENIPVAEVIRSSPDKMARELIYRPDIIRLYDPDPDHAFKYGGKGVYLTNPNQLGT